jgi:hypothetical protein
MYSVKRDKKGIYRTAELEYNKLEKKTGEGDTFFNIIKYTYGSKNFYGVKIAYSYRDTGLMVKIAFVELGGAPIFGIRKKDGVLIAVNSGKSFPLKYKTSPEHQVQTMSSTNGMSEKIHNEKVECMLTLKQLAYLAKADSATVTLMGTDETNSGKEKKAEFIFTKENFKIIKQFYDEEVMKKI